MTSTGMNLEPTPKTTTDKFVIGSRPAHEHKCGHRCNSPYCDDPRYIPCTDCGGPPIIIAGLEPWRGRS